MKREWAKATKEERKSGAVRDPRKLSKTFTCEIYLYKLQDVIKLLLSEKIRLSELVSHPYPRDPDAVDEIKIPKSRNIKELSVLLGKVEKDLQNQLGRVISDLSEELKESKKEIAKLQEEIKILSRNNKRQDTKIKKLKHNIRLLEEI